MSNLWGIIMDVKRKNHTKVTSIFCNYYDSEKCCNIALDNGYCEIHQDLQAIMYDTH